ncbi:MAG: DUF3341 domain-containing protein [Polyangiaceae bacterium]|nr:DUF3341 domain-containing protein [Polyangiaceae bacterium]
MAAHRPEGPPKLLGVVAEYETPTALVHAAEKVRDAGFQHWDTYTPFPIHGIDPAMGIRPTRLPWIVLCAGLTGLTTAALLQWWTNAVDYPWVISGKPFLSIPASVPVYFELTVLFSALTALGAMIVINGLPEPHHPLDLKERFGRATDDRFFLYIQARDPKFDESATRALLESTHPEDLDDVMEDQSSPAGLPRPLVIGLAALVCAAIVPFVLFVQARQTMTDQPRIHMVPDMDFQLKYKTQKASAFFADGRTVRPQEPATIAVGQLDEDEHLHHGRVEGEYARTFPSALPVDEAAMKRGQTQYDIFCAPCHGLSGAGDGIVSRRAQDKEQSMWVPPTNLTQGYLRRMPVGQMYELIGKGVRNMPAYGPQISIEDRWRIVLYVRALQRAGNATIEDVPAAERGGLN